jgi:hypothetical protein
VCLDLVGGKAGGVEDEYHIEFPVGGVGHEPLELRARLPSCASGIKVAVLTDEFEIVLGCDTSRGITPDPSLRLWHSACSTALYGPDDGGPWGGPEKHESRLPFDLGPIDHAVEAVAPLAPRVPWASSPSTDGVTSIARRESPWDDPRDGTRSARWHR